MAGVPKRPKSLQGANAAIKVGGSKASTCAKRIEDATVHKTQVTMTETMVQDAEALFSANDSEGTQLLSRGALTELLRQVGLETILGDGFAATARLAFDAHSADSHFLSLPEFKQLYYVVNQRYPELLPRPPFLTVHILSASGLPPADYNGKSDPFMQLMVAGKKHSRSQTEIKEKTLDPVWGEEFSDRYAYEEGDHLEFTVMDYDKGETDYEELGRGRLASADFHRPGGFSGDIPLTTNKKGYSPTLKVRVFVNALEKSAEAKRSISKKLKATVEEKILHGKVHAGSSLLEQPGAESNEKGMSNGLSQTAVNSAD
jgi:hypothetical protein